jgi:hypothetical protein
MDHVDRGLTYILLDLATAKLFVFVNGSFANNKDLSSQIRYKIILANKISGGPNEFRIKGNLIYWSFTKSKRITRSILASEIYNIVTGIDIVFAISLILGLIVK